MRNVVSAVMCVVTMLLLGCSKSEGFVPPEDRAVKAERELEVARKELGLSDIEPDIKTETTVVFCSKKLTYSFNANEQQFQKDSHDLLKATLVRAEAWIRKHSERHPRMQISEKEAFNTLAYQCKVIVFLDPLPTTSPPAEKADK